jgi:hypothetical protein
MARGSEKARTATAATAILLKYTLPSAPVEAEAQDRFEDQKGEFEDLNMGVREHFHGVAPASWRSTLSCRGLWTAEERWPSRSRC